MKLETVLLVALGVGIAVVATRSRSSSSLPGWEFSRGDVGIDCAQAEIVDFDAAVEDLEAFLADAGILEGSSREEVEARMITYFARDPRCREVHPLVIKAGDDLVTWTEWVDRMAGQFGGLEGAVVEPEPEGARVDLYSRDGLHVFGELLTRRTA